MTVGAAISACGNSFQWNLALRVLQVAEAEKVPLDAVVLLGLEPYYSSASVAFLVPVQGSTHPLLHANEAMPGK